MSTKELFESILQSYNNGCKIGKLQNTLKASNHNGFTESYDGSLLIVYFKEGVVIIGCGEISFINI